jgi:uncharacterized protein (TIGR00251 family)
MMPMARKGQDDAFITVKVVPRSSSEGVSIEEDGVWKVRVHAPAVEGKANDALIKLLSGFLGVSKGSIEIVAGGRSRIKTIRLSGQGKTAAQDILSGRNAATPSPSRGIPSPRR